VLVEIGHLGDESVNGHGACRALGCKPQGDADLHCLVLVMDEEAFTIDDAPSAEELFCHTVRIAVPAWPSDVHRVWVFVAPLVLA